MNSLNSVNLNFMVYFQALIEERHITRAAKRVGISQPAMSLALKELRVLFGDPLLVPVKNGFAATEVALALLDKINLGLGCLDSAIVEGLSFDPSTMPYRFKVMMTDYAGAILLPRLVQILEAEAPKVKLDVVTMEIDEDLSRVEDVACAVSFYPESVPEGFHEVTLFEEHYVCMLSRQHPRVRTTLSLDQFLAEKHMVVREFNGAIGVVNAALAVLGKSRDVVLEVPNFLLFPFISAETQLLITTTSRNARLFQDKLPIRILPVPLQLPIIPVKCLWHERMTNSLPHRWLREMILRVAQDVA